MSRKFSLFAFSFAAAIAGCSPQAHAADCAGLPSYEAFKKALTAARHADNGGFNHEMWGAVVDRTGQVCSVAYTGAALGDQWPGSRAIAVEKAGTANALSLPNYALSTANLYAGNQPGGYLYGLLQTNPVDAQSINKGPAMDFGTVKDPLVGQHPGGVVVFGGGLALYDGKGTLLGGIGVSGDTSCGDHNIAWRTRNALKLDYVPGGPSEQHNDAIIYDIGLTGKSSSGFGHPTCGNKEDDIAKTLPGTEQATK